jgi:hypothetical protein
MNHMEVVQYRKKSLNLMELGDLLTQLILIGFGAFNGAIFGSIVAQIFLHWYEKRRINKIKKKYSKSIDSVLYDLYKSKIYLCCIIPYCFFRSR